MFNKLKKQIFSENNNMFLIVGLGNPGMQYENTRHNAGFLAINKISKKYNCDISKLKFKGLFGKCEIENFQCILLKPQTYMNKSGECVLAFANFFKIKPENIIILFDDISLDVGKLRIRRKGSHGGHNGLKDICLSFNSEDFPRVKIGVGEKPHPAYNLADWVLSKFTEKELESLDFSLENSIKAVELIVCGKIETAMNKFNS